MIRLRDDAIITFDSDASGGSNVKSNEYLASVFATMVSRINIVIFLREFLRTHSKSKWSMKLI